MTYYLWLGRLPIADYRATALDAASINRVNRVPDLEEFHREAPSQTHKKSAADADSAGGKFAGRTAERQHLGDR